MVCEFSWGVGVVFRPPMFVLEVEGWGLILVSWRLEMMAGQFAWQPKLRVLGLTLVIVGVCVWGQKHSTTPTNGLFNVTLSA